MPAGWRIVKHKYAAQAFDGEGARLNGGRWNGPGTSMVYTSQTASLAVLEILVHLQRSAMLPRYTLVTAHFAAAQVTRLDRGRLPKSWRAYPPPPELQAIGDAWVRDGTSLVLEVPSALIEHESNFLINPHHPDFPAMTIDPAAALELDVRLLQA
jgi:RES domain-containing protein